MGWDIRALNSFQLETEVHKVEHPFKKPLTRLKGFEIASSSRICVFKFQFGGSDVIYRVSRDTVLVASKDTFWPMWWQVGYIGNMKNWSRQKVKTLGGLVRNSYTLAKPSDVLEGVVRNSCTLEKLFKAQESLVKNSYPQKSLLRPRRAGRRTFTLQWDLLWKQSASSPTALSKILQWWWPCPWGL